jgi:hypothetical protein
MSWRVCGATTRMSRRVRRAATRMSWRVCGAALWALLMVASACATSGGGRRNDAHLAIDCNVPDARVYVDDVFVGRAIELRRRGLAVRSGSRRVELRADGWFTAYRDVAVAPAGRTELGVQLRPVPPNEPGE